MQWRHPTFGATLGTACPSLSRIDRARCRQIHPNATVTRVLLRGPCAGRRLLVRGCSLSAYNAGKGAEFIKRPRRIRPCPTAQLTSDTLLRISLSPQRKVRPNRP